MPRLCSDQVFFFLELNIQPALNFVLLPRAGQEATSSPQEGAASSTANQENADSTSTPIQAAAGSGIA